MSIVIGNGGERRRSAWREAGGDDGRGARSEDEAQREAGTRMMEVSLREEQLLLRLRMLGAGVYEVAVRKSQRGMWGLLEGRVVE
jgi:hypothetical protein